jgi:hypothetical protein
MENEPIRMVGYVAAAAAGLLCLLISLLPLSGSKQQALLAFVAMSTPLVSARYGRQYVAPLGPNREQSGEGHPAEAMREEFTPDAGGGPEAQPASS